MQNIRMSSTLPFQNTNSNIFKTQIHRFSGKDVVVFFVAGAGLAVQDLPPCCGQPQQVRKVAGDADQALSSFQEGLLSSGSSPGRGGNPDQLGATDQDRHRVQD